MKSLIKAGTSLATGGVNSLASATGYVDGQIDKKRKEKFQDKLSAKPRKEFNGQIMTDKEVEEMNRKMQQYIEMDKQVQKLTEEMGLEVEDKPGKNTIVKSKNTGYKKTNKVAKQHNKKKEILKKMKQSRNLQTTEIDSYRYYPSYYDGYLKRWWKYFDAAKRDDTALFYFGHSKDGGEDKITCKDRIKQEYDKRYGEFFCIDNNNANDDDIYDKMIESMERAIEKKLPYFKLYLDAHGGLVVNEHYDYKDSYLALKFSMETLKQLVELFKGELDGKTIIFVKNACFDGDKSKLYNFNYEDIGRIFSIMCPHSKVVMEDHIDKTSSHFEAPRKYSTSHFKFKYRIIQNGTEKVVTKKQKNKEIGGSYSNKKSYSPEEDIPWKGFCVFLSICALYTVCYLGVEGVKACCEACRERQNTHNTENNQNNTNADNVQQSENNTQQSEKKNILRLRENNNNANNINLDVGNRNHRSRNINNNINNDILVDIKQNINNHIGGDLITQEVLPSTDPLNKTI